MLGAVIGTGGFGVTYAAWDVNLSVPVAIKEYFPVKYAHRNTEESDDVLLRPEGRSLYVLGLERFRREAQVLAQFKNIPGVVNINECFNENGTSYIAMEYVHGVPLDEYVRVNKPASKELLQMMLRPISALEIIHRQGVHHRDITPRNLLVQEDGSIKLIDFGSAREIEHTTNLIVVSDGYAPVEQYDTQRPQGPWGDIYSISATIYHMLTGVMPPPAISRTKHDSLRKPSELGVKLKKYQEKALMAGLAVDPEKRIRSIEEFRARMYNMPLPEEVRRQRAFMRRVCAAAACIILLMMAVMVNFTCGLPLGAGLLYALYPDGFHVVGTMMDDAEVTVPSSRLFLPVTDIDREVFRDSRTLERITIPGSVKEISPQSFSNCQALKRVTLEEGVEAIAYLAFSNCRELHTVYLPDSIQSIEPSAFDDTSEFLTVWGTTGEGLVPPDGVACAVRTDYTVEENETGLTLISCVLSPAQAKIVLPSYIDDKPVTQVAVNALGGIVPEWITSITFPYYMETIYSWSNGSVVERDIETIYGNEVTVIADYAFMNSNRQEIVLPAKLKEIGEGAFCNAAITSLELPDSVVEVGEKAFSQCTNLQKVSLSPNMKVIRKYTFSDCSALQQVYIPEGIETLEHLCFSDCNSLTYLWLPDSVVNLSIIALPNTLQYLYIPPGVRTELFNVSENMVIAGYPGTAAEAASYAAYAFDDVSRWNVFPDPARPGVVTINTDSTKAAVCAGFDVVNNIPVTKVNTVGSGEEPILESVELPLAVKTIGVNAFRECRRLTEIVFPKSLEELQSGAFSRTGLKEIYLPQKLSLIGYRVFYECADLEEVIMTGYCEELIDAFMFCPSLRRVLMPMNMGDINGGFNSCEDLVIVFPGTYGAIRHAFDSEDKTTLYAQNRPREVENCYFTFRYLESDTVSEIFD